MKKLVLSVALLAGLAIVSCSKDDDKKETLADCVTCTMSVQGNEIEQEFCEEDFDSRKEYEDYVSNF